MESADYIILRKKKKKKIIMKMKIEQAIVNIF